MSRTYINLKKLIGVSRYEYKDMYEKLDLFFYFDRITFDEYMELSGLLVKPEPKPEIPVLEESSEYQEY